jgi:hypothetical protein
MSFTVQDYHDLVDLLEKRPQWRSDLRRLLLSDDLLALPAIVDKLAITVSELAEAQKRTEARIAELVEAQQHTEQQVAALTARVDALTARVDALTARVDALAARMEELAEAQRHTEQQVAALTARVDALAARMEELAEAQRHTEQQVAALTAHVEVLTVEQRKMQNKLARVDGRTLEIDFRQKAPAYFGRLMRRLKIVEVHMLEDQLAAQLSPEEYDDCLRLDLILTGLLWQKPDKPQIWLAVEVSSVVDREDIIRARRRADLLRKAGYPTIPVAAGEEATLGAESEARVQRVALIQDGRTLLWDEALSASLAS